MGNSKRSTARKRSIQNTKQDKKKAEEVNSLTSNALKPTTRTSLTALNETIQNRLELLQKFSNGAVKYFCVLHSDVVLENMH